MFHSTLNEKTSNVLIISKIRDKTDLLSKYLLDNKFISKTEIISLGDISFVTELIKKDVNVKSKLFEIIRLELSLYEKSSYLFSEEDKYILNNLYPKILRICC